MFHKTLFSHMVNFSYNNFPLSAVLYYNIYINLIVIQWNNVLLVSKYSPLEIKVYYPLLLLINVLLSNIHKTNEHIEFHSHFTLIHVLYYFYNYNLVYYSVNSIDNMNSITLYLVKCHIQHIPTKNTYWESIILF